MDMQVINLTPTEKRVLLLFDAEQESSEDERVVSYLSQHNLEPRRQYHEQRDGKEYLVYYFGHCYLEDHLSALKAMATGADL